MEGDHLCNFGRGHHVHFCEISYLELWQPGTICAILVAAIKGNNPVNFFLNLDQWFRRRYQQEKFTHDRRKKTDHNSEG